MLTYYITYHEAVKLTLYNTVYTLLRQPYISYHKTQLTLIEAQLE